jgi:hypothetical protein
VTTIDPLDTTIDPLDTTIDPFATTIGRDQAIGRANEPGRIDRDAVHHRTGRIVIGSPVAGVQSVARTPRGPSRSVAPVHRGSAMT